MLVPVQSRRRGFGQLPNYTTVALAVQTQEGYYPGSIAYRNNNPGNLMYAGQPGATGKDASGFAIFPDYATGFQALQNQIALNASRGMTISQFTAAYAPASVSGNNPALYAQNIANATGLSPSDLLSSASDASGGVLQAGILPDLSTVDLSNVMGIDISAVPAWAWLALGLVGVFALVKMTD